MSKTRRRTLVLVPERAPYEQQPGETGSQFEAFRLLRNMPPAERSCKALAALTGKSVKQMYAWSTLNSWAQRIEVFDYDMGQIDLQVIENARKKMAKKHAEVAEKALDKVSAAIDNIQPTDLSPMEAINWLKVASLVERQARGEPTLTKVEHVDGNNAIMSQSSKQGPGVDSSQIVEILNVFIQSGADIPGLGSIKQAIEAAGQPDREIVDSEDVEIYPPRTVSETESIPPSG